MPPPDQTPPDYSLRLRPDGPQLDSITMPDGPEVALREGPVSPEAQPAWLDDMKSWREARPREIGYRDDLYRSGELDWTRRIFTQVQILVWDRSLYDPTTGAYTPDRALAVLTDRFGPIDAVLLWPAYPNLGLDGRTQFDLLRDLPGGVPALAKLVADFHARDVRVFFPVLEWDGGTRDAGVSRYAEADALLRAIDADGINFDTLAIVPDESRALAAAQDPPIALEPQFAPQNSSLSASAISWNDWVLWDSAPFVPRVSLVKWLEPRHMVAVTDRYPQDKTDSLQHAFFNGQGVAILENLWGFRHGLTPRDAEAVRRCTRILRAYADLLTSPEWEPHTPVLQAGVFASRFPGENRTLWTFVNRNAHDLAGEQLAVKAEPGVFYYDLWHGRRLMPTSRGTLGFALEARGYGAVLAVKEPDIALAALLEAADDRPLNTFGLDMPVPPQTMTPIPATAFVTDAPNGMVEIPAADYDFAVDGIEIENGDNPGVGVQFPWETAPRRTHRHRIQVPRFFIDRTPVTNAEFKRFLDNTGYPPADGHNFLRDWTDGAFPDGWANKPVTWVAIEDARAYASWAGKRLPHVWEWQYAAQGTDGRLYPWGTDWNPDAVPPLDRTRNPRPPTDVDAFPAGASPFGVLDMVGNIAQWTDEFTDAHTRAAILRGGDYYRPAGSFWYFPKSHRLDEQAKYLLAAPSRDRSGMVGFRCVVDAA